MASDAPMSTHGTNNTPHSTISTTGGCVDDQMFGTFRKLIDEDVAVPVAAMNVLVLLIQQSNSQTWMELERELGDAINSLKKCRLDYLGGRTNISIASGCDLFMKYVTRSFNANMEYVDFSTCKVELLRRGQMFAGKYPTILYCRHNSCFFLICSTLRT